MPTLKKIADDIVMSAQGGIFAEQSKFQIPFIYDLIHQYRQVVMRIAYSKTGRINPLWLNQYIPEYSEDIQESKLFVKFECPAPVILDDQTDGFLYIGTLDKNINFKKAQSRAELAMYNQHRATKSGIKTIWSDGYIEVWGNPLEKEIRIDGVFANPTLLPEYNIDFSEYPLGGDDIMAMKKLIFVEQTKQIGESPANTTAKIVDKPTSIA